MEGISAAGIGVRGRATKGGTGVAGESETPTGVTGTSGSGVGIDGKGGTIGVSGQGATRVIGVGSSVGVAGASDDGWAVSGGTITGTAVRGNSSGSGLGVSGTSSGGTGVYGSSTGGFGMYATSESGSGIFASAHAQGQPACLCVNYAQGTGVLGQSYRRTQSGRHLPGSGTGVSGESGSGIGVQGSASTGRGAVFSGGAAQLQLVPSTQKAPPAAGEQGDMFLDSSAKLWLCTAGSTAKAAAKWAHLGSGSGSSGVGPITGTSDSGGTAGVQGENTQGGAGGSASVMRLGAEAPDRGYRVRVPPSESMATQQAALACRATPTPASE